MDAPKDERRGKEVRPLLRSARVYVCIYVCYVCDVCMYVCMQGMGLCVYV